MRNFAVDHLRGHSFIGSALSRDSTVLDLGMNHGDFAAAMADRHGCLIFGAEANPDLAARIRQTERLRCCNLAIAARGGVVQFRVDPGNSEASAMVAAGASPADGVISVPSASVAEFMAMNAIGRADLVKMDIEGAELEVLLAPDTGWLNSVVQLSVEFHAFLDPRQKPVIHDLLERLRARGFHSIDFSTELSNVLLVNTRLLPLSAADRAALVVEKYRAGMGRIVRRLVAHG